MAFEQFGQFWGALATPDLVGRKEIIDAFETLLAKQAETPRVLFFLGKGGMGKTRLLDKLLRVASEKSNTRVAKNVVDFYHMNTHTSNGFADALYEVLTPPSDDFSEYQKERQAFEHNLARGDVSKLNEQIRKKALDAFNISMKALAAKQNVVVALDTAEKAIYGSFDEQLEKAESWKWFFESIKEWGNVTILLAGRWLSEALLGDLQTTLGTNNVQKIVVGPFSEEESLKYFNEVELVARLKDKDTAERIRQLPKETRQVAHIYSKGEPILLGLLVDSLSAVNRIPSILQDSLEIAKKKNDVETEKIREVFENELISKLKESPTGDTIVALGRAPKGADERLMSLLLGGISLEASRERLKEVQNFSFVKRRPLDTRIFLHDEMYALLNKWIYIKPGDAPNAAKAEDAIIHYYHEYQVQAYRDEMDEMYAPVEAGQKNYLDLKLLTEVNTHRNTALTELVYYRLRQDTIKGYERFYRYAREATYSGDILLEAQLQSELASFLAEKDPDVLKEEGIALELLQWSIVIRPVTRAWASQQYAQIKVEADAIRRNHAGLLKANSPGSEALLATWEAYGLTYLGGEDNFALAHEKLNHAIQSVEKKLTDKRLTEVNIWRLTAVIGLAYRVRGYLFRVRGLMADAVENYRRAAGYFRKINLRIELAVSLNDMGFAMAEQGKWDDARSIVDDALDLRRHLGPRVPVGLSLNTLAWIDLQEGRYANAIQHAESALSLFTALGDERRAGLAYISLAEAQRRFSVVKGDPDDRIRLLHEAREYARRANSIFESIGERSRCIEALIEEGCATRDWVRVRIENPSGRDNIQRLIDESKDAFRKATKLAAETGILYRQIDALVDLAWLGLYIDNGQMLNDAEMEVLNCTPTEYLINKKIGKPSIAREAAQTLIWPQIGKLHILRGHDAFRKFYGNEKTSTQMERKKQETELEIASENYCLGLQYSSFYSPDYHALRNVKNQIYERFRKLHEEELTIVSQKVQSTKKEYHFETCIMEEYLKYRALWYGT